MHSNKANKQITSNYRIMSNLNNIAQLFATQGNITEIVPLGKGLINDTYLVHTDTTQHYVLQRINTRVFPDVEMVMNNIRITTSHIRNKLQQNGVDHLEQRVLQFIPVRDEAEKLYIENEDGAWRMMIYIANSVTKQEVNVDNALAAGRAFGQFQAMLADVPDTLGETIKDFHNMEWRIEQLRQACIEDRVCRFDEPAVQELLEKIGQRCQEMTQAERLFRAGMLPKRICHCDTKVNNMLFNSDGSEVLCVIDLDTVMPSFIFSDYGDFLRTAANTVAEDEQDFSLIAFREDIYEAFTRGYLSEAKAFLTEREVSMLPFATRLFPYMQSVRFLWDYLNGDEYWKVAYPTHNLVRAQNQMRYLECIEEYMFNHGARTLDCVNWADTYPYKPEVWAEMRHDDENIYVHYRVTEQSIRAVAMQDQDNVWEDSCVEIFIMPNPDDGIYYNFECTCTGKLLLAAGKDRHERQRAPKEITDNVWRWASLGTEPFNERHGETTWEVKLRIPKDSFFLHGIESLADMPLRINIYKCGDKLTVPHFLSLFPIKTDKPDFHRPEFFQEY